MCLKKQNKALLDCLQGKCIDLNTYINSDVISRSGGGGGVGGG